MGCQTTKELPKDDFYFFIEQTDDSDHMIWSGVATLPISQTQVKICNQPILLASDIDCVRIAESNFGKCLIFQLTQRAAIQFFRIIVDSLGRKIVLFFNGKPLGLSLPLEKASLDGTIAIFPEIYDENLDKLVNDLNSAICAIKKLKDQ